MQSVQRKELFGHPIGLFVLFFTELWERFSFYGMRAILVLYLTSKISSENPGLGWTSAEALSLYGTYGMWVYLLSIPGGFLADRVFGQKKMVMIGGLLLCAGHSILAIPALWAFYTGICLIVLGVGGLKPNISSMVGGLYPQGDIRRDAAFTYFYMGINIGAFTASIIVGAVGEKLGWHYGFGLAGIGMLLGQLVFFFGQKHLEGVGDYVAAKRVAETRKAVPLTKIEKDRIMVLLISFILIIVFWGAFEQGGGLLNLFARDKIDRTLFGFEIPASNFQALNPLCIILFGVPVATYWMARRKAAKESSALFKIAVGTIVMGAGYLFMTGAAMEAASSGTGRAAMFWLVGAYLLHTIGELSSSPVSLSFITKLAPARYTSIMMGVYFAMTGLGNKLAGTIGEYAEGAGEVQTFVGIFVFCLAVGALILVFLKKLNALTHNAEADELDAAMAKSSVSADSKTGRVNSQKRPAT